MYLPKNSQFSSKFIKFTTKTIATFGGIGFIPWAPGTFGSICAIPIFFLIPLPHGLTTYLLFTIFLFLMGIIFSHLYEIFFYSHDPKEVVIDEVLGQLITLEGINIYLNYTINLFNFKNQIVTILLAFILFRIFDILKPWPISLINDRVKGGIGIILDDVLAAFFAIFSFIIIEVTKKFIIANM